MNAAMMTFGISALEEKLKVFSFAWGIVSLEP
jgi:hypothetical protein